MGKASKWIMNFLLARKEEKERKKDFVSVEETEELSNGIWPPPTPTPLIKRRWSFGRSSSKHRAHKSSKSFDLITANQVVKQAIIDLQNQHPHIDTMDLLVAGTATGKTAVVPNPARYRMSREVADAAAIKIQAVFRSYLARKALCALRGLVKLQALIRGHQVRKQTTATLRQMHALMAIQVRARFQRAQMAEDSHHFVKSKSSRYRNFPQENELRRSHTEAVDTNLYEAQGISKGTYGYLNHSQIGRIEQGNSSYFSGQVSVSRQEHHQYKQFSFSTTQNTPRHHREACNIIPGRASFSYQKPDNAHDYILQPNYMTKTQSSRAKARSHSEPKQRPESNMTEEGKRVALFGMTTNSLAYAQSQRSYPLTKCVTHDNQDPWFINLHQRKRVLNDEDSDASGTIFSPSKCCNSLLDYEPHLNLY